MDELTKVALVGTSKFAGAVQATDHPTAALIPGVVDECRERSLLLRCGARAVYDMAGKRSVADIAPLAPAPVETGKVASRKLAGLLQAAATIGGNELLIDFLRQMNERAVILPPEVLPLLLQSKDAGIRRYVIPILGERGAWLCRQDADWSHFLASAAEQTELDVEALKLTWDEGTIDQRCQALAILRRHDPLAAREWLAQIFAKEKANHRVKLVESLETGLCDDDEAFLDSCLDDRSSAVAQAAARLLSRLTRSALAARMRGRADALLAIETKGLILKKTKLVCTPPQTIDRDWERDGISKRAPAGQGERALWTERVLAAVPPSYWQSHFGLEPPALIAAVADDPFASSVVAGWAEAAVLFAASEPASAAWLLPLWRHWVGAFGSIPKENRWNAQLDLMALLPAMAADVDEAAIASLFEPLPGWEDVEVLNCVMALPPPWSARFSAALLATVRQRVQSRANEAALRWASVLAAQACSIPAESIPLALAPWKLAPPEQPTAWIAPKIQQEIDLFTTRIKAREEFMTELDASFFLPNIGAHP